MHMLSVGTEVCLGEVRDRTMHSPQYGQNRRTVRARRGRSDYEARTNRAPSMGVNARTAPNGAPRTAAMTEMTAFVESCTKTASGSAAAVARRTRGKPRARGLLR